ncbi:hypothetical protein [Haliangium ochraceum]|uniref:Lipoprotein n=1 Tax=Haliangium ochraceum (strain DSM 14365 / JCM 11303 / SMP-2) TaxID=502025 RepID=D0LPT2_HALO1|nr:hypothetical protein [Haliangium ochraceum]ACY15445.1 hypothetical protein Hoch_2928 [Haliangium ochraceum DSM 14365]
MKLHSPSRFTVLAAALIGALLGGCELFEEPASCPDGDGFYCGEAIGQRSGALYSCSEGEYTFVELCDGECKVTGNGADDVCETDTPPPSCDCPAGETCNSDGVCVECPARYSVAPYQCETFSTADGNGPGGGEIFELCATTDEQSGFMIVKVRKYSGDGNPAFSDRPYQVRVSGSGEGPCGPDKYFYYPSDDDPAGVGTEQLTFDFPSRWDPGQTEKAYCVTASVREGDPGYDPESQEQESWWYSDKVRLTRTPDCN